MAEALPAMAPGAVWVQSSTVGATGTARLAALAGEHGVGRRGARAGVAPQTRHQRLDRHAHRRGRPIDRDSLRSRWRFTFRRRVPDARLALREGPIAAGAAAMAALIDLACETRDVDYFRSDCPVAAGGRCAAHPVGVPVRVDPPGDGRIAGGESALADVLAGMLPVPDAWVTFGTGGRQRDERRSVARRPDDV